MQVALSRLLDGWMQMFWKDICYFFVMGCNNYNLDFLLYYLCIFL